MIPRHFETKWSGQSTPGEFYSEAKCEQGCDLKSEDEMRIIPVCSVMHKAVYSYCPYNWNSLLRGQGEIYKKQGWKLINMHFYMQSFWLFLLPNSMYVHCKLKKQEQN